MASMSDFFTREKANEGKKVFLTLPDGTETEEYLIIRGVDSDYYVAAFQEVKRRLSLNTDKDNPEYTPKDAEIDILASLVAGWSFKEDYTTENIAKFLREAPQIALKIDDIAGNRSLFFGKKQSS